MEAFLELAQRCAPHVQVETLAAVASIESGLNPFAIRINSDRPLSRQPTTKAEAIAAATALIGEGHDIDLGLGGVNVADLRKLQISVADAFDACANLGATGRLLDTYYRAAAKAGAKPLEAERLMLVAYFGRGDTEPGTLVGFDKRVASEREALRSRLAALTIGTVAGRPSPALPPREFSGAASTPAIVAVASKGKPPIGGETEDAERASASRQTQPSRVPRWDVFAAARRSSQLVYSQGDH